MDDTVQETFDLESVLSDESPDEVDSITPTPPAVAVKLAPRTAPGVDPPADRPNAPQPDSESGADATVKTGVARLLKGKEKEWAAVTNKQGPLRFLDLPVDILREIISHLPHTNDLTSLALCHSILHNLAIPSIYSRFDIVWPDTQITSEPRPGVDALTYGLSTLVMSEETFGEAPHQRRAAENSGRCRNDTTPDPLMPIRSRRRGNWYARYIKKFSLGNGPSDWVQEYLITKEGGKMLGTLVALAVARMYNLETFIWDMPTGVLREVWLALSSLADRHDGLECRLDKVWIRWHDSRPLDLQSPLPPPPNLGHAHLPPTNAVHNSGVASAHSTGVIPMHNPSSPSSSLDRMENPTFSELPPLKSLSVLDIDELSCLDEMSVLIARSQKRVKELRVGVAQHAATKDWTDLWDGEGLQQVDYRNTRTSASRAGDKRLGGVLGVLVGRMYNLRNNSETIQASLSKVSLQAMPSLSISGQSQGSSSTDQTTVPPESSSISAIRALRSSRAHARVVGPFLENILQVETLEFERIKLSVNVMTKAFDWHVLTSLTLLRCSNHEFLWRTLRRNYSPKNCCSPKTGLNSDEDPGSFALNLKKIHTDTVSPALISFLKETLAPNSLEVLFLQEDRGYSSSVTVDSIFRGPIRRHRASLKKLIIDSGEKSMGDFQGGQGWKKWMLKREGLSYLTSGRMENLRELGVSVDYKDWHPFLQRLKFIPHLRSIYVPNVADHPHGNNIDPKELAMQIVNVISFCPEIELCYMGILGKCFEVLENKPLSYDLHTDSDASNHEGPSTTPGGPGVGVGLNGIPGGVLFGNSAHNGNEPLILDEDEDDDDEAVDDDDEDGAVVIGADDDEDEDGVETESEDETVEEDDDDNDSFFGAGEEEKMGSALRLREILFYDEKVAVFKARHGRL
ncbi:hypothetical protein K402DRAFT_462525 [Aulographum hederae CBS 113979]|uniref:F-box domain-containing protein n=1 Tax=Aulographum hederae CBS 113979 TaxID=1176131 RepID=A0A6G1H3K5_9PEZI|nr:hypothetical protein K402DRAFT_462525 [Aulographum hederae CBS 113979]